MGGGGGGGGICCLLWGSAHDTDAGDAYKGRTLTRQSLCHNISTTERVMVFHLLVHFLK